MNLNQVFSPDNLFWRLLSKAVDFIGLSLFWVVLSLPIVTIGSANCGLYLAVTKSLVKWDEDEGAFKTMFSGFKANLKNGIPVTLIAEAIGIALAYGYYVMKSNWGSHAGAVLFVVYDLLLFVPAGIVIYIFPMMAKYSQSLKEYFVNSAFLTIRHFPTTIVLVLLYLQLIIFVIEKWSPVFIVPTTIFLFTSLFLERIFKKYPTEDSK